MPFCISCALVPLALRVFSCMQVAARVLSYNLLRVLVVARVLSCSLLCVCFRATCCAHARALLALHVLSRCLLCILVCSACALALLAPHTLLRHYLLHWCSRATCLLSRCLFCMSSCASCAARSLALLTLLAVSRLSCSACTVCGCAVIIFSG